MYSETARVGIEVNRVVRSQSLFSVRTHCEKWRETNRPKCFGTSDVFFCGHMNCPRREDCEKLVSPWNFD